MAAPCSSELTNLAPTVNSCPQDNESVLFLNVAGVTGGYAFRTWGTIKNCIAASVLSHLHFDFLEFEVGIGAPPVMSNGDNILIINTANIVQDSVFITMGGNEVPRSPLLLQQDYTVDYSDPTKITITFGQPVQDGQHFIIHFANIS